MIVGTQISDTKVKEDKDLQDINSAELAACVHAFTLRQMKAYPQ